MLYVDFIWHAQKSCKIGRGGFAIKVKQDSKGKQQLQLSIFLFQVQVHKWLLDWFQSQKKQIYQLYKYCIGRFQTTLSSQLYLGNGNEHTNTSKEAWGGLFASLHSAELQLWLPVAFVQVKPLLCPTGLFLSPVHGSFMLLFPPWSKVHTISLCKNYLWIFNSVPL